MGKRVSSHKRELLIKSREAALSAVQIFNNPLITFKSETFIILMIISWTYLMHAYYRDLGIDYRYYTKPGMRKKYDRTKRGAHKYWELERCINEAKCPLEPAVKENLRFLIGIRHEIEHQMTTKIDDLFSGRFQACCLNFNNSIKKLFGEDYSIENHLSFSLQFSSISVEQKEMLEDYVDLPKNIEGCIIDFDSALEPDIFNSPLYSYRVIFVQKTANQVGQADKVIEFIKPEDRLSEDVNAQYVLVKEKEKIKYKPKQIVEIMKSEGFPSFTMKQHTNLWKFMDAKNPIHQYGVEMSDKQWYWYERWVSAVRQHCRESFSIE